MSVCVFIIGTNCTGKTSVAKEMILRNGGIKSASRDITICNNGRVALAGKYALDRKFGGVDMWSETKPLERVVKEGLRKCPVIIAEGMYVNTTGMNLTNAMFCAQKHLVVLLFAPASTIYKRLHERGKKKKRGYENILFAKQAGAYQSALRWKRMGVDVLAFDTEKYSTSQIANALTRKIEQLCGENSTEAKKT